MRTIPDGHVDHDDCYDPCDLPNYSRQQDAHDWFMATADDAAIMWNREMNVACRYNRQFSIWFPKREMQ